MSQKTNPISLRLQKSNKHFSSCWYSDFFYSQSLDYDFKIDSYIETLSEQIGHLQMFSFLQSHYKKAYIHLFFLDKRGIREERETKLKISRTRTSVPLKNQNTNLWVSCDKKKRKSISLKEDSVLNMAKRMALGFAQPLLVSSDFDKPVHENGEFYFRNQLSIQQAKPILSQAPMITDQAQKWRPFFVSQMNKTAKNDNDNACEKDKNVPEVFARQVYSVEGTNKTSTFLQLQQGFIYSLFRQNVVYACFQGIYSLKSAPHKNRNLSKIEQASCAFFFAQEHRFYNLSTHADIYSLVQDCKDSNNFTKYKKNKQNHLLYLFPKKDLKQLPVRLFSFGLLCALQNLKNSVYKLSSRTYTSIDKSRYTQSKHKKHTPLCSACSSQDLMEVSVSQPCSQKRCEQIVEEQRKMPLFLSTSVDIYDFGLLGMFEDKQSESNLFASTPTSQIRHKTLPYNKHNKDPFRLYLKHLKKNTIAITALLPRLSLIQGLQIQNVRRQHGFLRHQFVSIYPIRIVKDAQNAVFIVNEIVHLIQKNTPFRKIKDQIVRELQASWTSEAGSVDNTIGNQIIKGVRFSCSGRVGGRSKKAQKTKTQSVQWGETSLHVFSSKLSFAKGSAATPFGKIGVKVWVCYK